MTTKFNLVSLLLVLSLCKKTTANAQINIQDSLALVDLYNSTDGPNWTRNDRWLSEYPVSTWYGVTVYNYRVYWLDLHKNKLKGQIRHQREVLQILLS